MSGGGGPESTIEQISNKEDIIRITPEDKKAVADFLDGNESKESIKNTTKDTFQKAITDIRNKPETSRENALILQTYAVLFLGVKSQDIGGIDGRFGEKTWAILRKCQAEGVGGNKVSRVKTDELNRIGWKQTTEAKATILAADTESTTPAPAADASTEDVPASTVVTNGFENTPTKVTEGLKSSLENLTINGAKIPEFLMKRIDLNKINLGEVNDKGVYVINLNQGMLGGIKMEGTIHINNEGELANQDGETRDAKSDISINIDATKFAPNDKIKASLANAIGKNISDTIEQYPEIRKNLEANMKAQGLEDAQIVELLDFIKSSRIQFGDNKYTIAQAETGISINKA